MNTSKIILLSINFILIIIIVTIYTYYKKIHLYNKQPFKNLWSPNKKQKLKKLLSDSISCFKKINVEFMPVFGTLLGLVRNGGIIPWDDDMDISVDKKDFEKILENKELFKSVGVGVFLYKKNFNNAFIKLFLLSEKNIPECNWSWPFIDIFTHYTKDENFFIIDNSNTTKFAKNEIFPLRTNLFENIPMNIPKNVEYILNSYYGNDWEKVCYSSTYSHQEEKNYTTQYKIKCDEIKKIDEKIFDNVWLINLDRRPDRLKISKDRLKSIKINNPHIWSATDSKFEYMKKIYDDIKGFKISIGECACYLSHKKLWAHIYELGISHAIIFEDDIIMTPNITKKTILNQINNSEGFSILFLGYCYQKINVSYSEPKIGRAVCAHAYVISRHAIEKLLSKKNNFSIPIDVEMENICKDNLCFLSYDVKDSVNFGGGIIKQDNSIVSDLRDKHIVYSL